MFHRLRQLIHIHAHRLQSFVAYIAYMTSSYVSMFKLHIFSILVRKLYFSSHIFLPVVDLHQLTMFRLVFSCRCCCCWCCCFCFVISNPKCPTHALSSISWLSGAIRRSANWHSTHRCMHFMCYILHFGRSSSYPMCIRQRFSLYYIWVNWNRCQNRSA